jgi:hypothetical protein
VIEEGLLKLLEARNAVSRSRRSPDPFDGEEWKEPKIQLFDVGTCFENLEVPFCRPFEFPSRFVPILCEMIPDCDESIETDD